MVMKPPHISVAVRLTLKNKPPEFRGMSGQTIAFGKNQPLELTSLILSIVKTVLDFYIHTMPEDATTPEKLNAQIREIAEILATWQAE
jgi:hypothetical protein